MSHAQTKLERVTINLIPQASVALADGMEMTGHSKTDFINRAIQAYSYFEELTSNGGKVLVREPGDDELAVIKFL